MLSWLWRRKKPGEGRVIDLTKGPGSFSIDVLGESKYQQALDLLCAGKSERGHKHRVEAKIVPEKDEPALYKAFRVVIGEMTVGHLDPKFVKRYRIALTSHGYEGAMAVCSALIVGGWKRSGDDQGHFGVKLDLPLSHAPNKRARRRSA